MGKSALVTGGAKRLGRAMVLHLAKRGYDVAIHYSSSADEAEDTAKEARKHGVKAITVHADLLDATMTETLVARASAALAARRPRFSLRRLLQSKRQRR